MGKCRRDQNAVVLQHPADLRQRFLRLRHDMQRIGHDDRVKAFVGIGQVKHILHGKCSLAEQLSRFASAIISGDASVASIWTALFTMFFAISPVPVASSSTALCRTAGRSSSYSRS